jgi:hypothetical protein
MTVTELLAALAFGLFFSLAGILSLRIIFNEKFRQWFLRKTQRRSLPLAWWRIPLKKSEVKFWRRTNEGTLLAGAVLIALIFLPVGLIMLVVVVVNAITMLLQ